MAHLLKRGSMLVALLAVAMFSTTGLFAAQTANNAVGTGDITIQLEKSITPQGLKATHATKLTPAQKQAIADFCIKLGEMFVTQGGFTPDYQAQVKQLINDFATMDWVSGKITEENQDSIANLIKILGAEKERQK